MKQKVLIVILSVFIMLLIPTTSIFAVSSNDNIENDNYPKVKNSEELEFSNCIILIDGDGYVSKNYTFAIRIDLTFVYSDGSHSIYEIFKREFHHFSEEFVDGELKYFTGYIDYNKDQFNLVGFARSAKINHKNNT